MTEEFEIYESKINGNSKDKFDILESMATFSHNTFLYQIKHNLEFYGMTVQSLLKSINISEFRMSALINGRANFEYTEVDAIKKRLHI